jgi:hypothetical protein
MAVKALSVCSALVVTAIVVGVRFSDASGAPSKHLGEPLASSRHVLRPPGYGLRPATRWRMYPEGRCRGVQIAVGTSIPRAIASRPPGTTFCIGRGLHRIAKPLIAKSFDRFIGERGAVIDGSKRLVSFKRTGSYWSIGDQTEENRAVVGSCELAAHGACKFADDVYYDDVAMRRVLAVTDLRPGTFYFDYAADRIFIGSPPAGHKVEVAVATRAWEGIGVGAYNVTVRNLIVQKFATEAQVAAIDAGRGWDVENNEVRLSHAGGIGDATMIRHNYVHDNGQIGVGGNAPNLTVAGNEISYNNYARFCDCWEAGGGKWVKAQHLTIQGNFVHDNRGPGLWTDTDNIDVLYRGNVVERNSGAGIFHEASYQAVIRNNVLRGNGFAWKGWLEGAGILVNSSPNVDIFRNVVTNNADGIGITQWDRGSDPTYGPHQVHDISVHDNTITMRRGFTGLLQGVGDESYYSSRNNRFEHNTYRLGCQTRYFVWRGDNPAAGYGSMTAAEWRSSGLDTDGRFSSIC